MVSNPLSNAKSLFSLEDSTGRGSSAGDAPAVEGERVRISRFWAALALLLQVVLLAISINALLWRWDVVADPDPGNRAKEKADFYFHLADTGYPLGLLALLLVLMFDPAQTMGPLQVVSPLLLVVQRGMLHWIWADPTWFSNYIVSAHCATTSPLFFTNSPPPP
jgi:hypothetical protein